MEKLCKILKMVLIPLLFICLLDMPYGYYMFVRVVAMVVFALLAYYEYEQENMAFAVVYLIALILFQPLIKIPLGRTLWNIVDVAMAVLLIFTFNKSENV